MRNSSQNKDQHKATPTPIPTPTNTKRRRKVKMKPKQSRNVASQRDAVFYWNQIRMVQCGRVAGRLGCSDVLHVVWFSKAMKPTWMVKRFATPKKSRRSANELHNWSCNIHRFRKSYFIRSLKICAIFYPILNILEALHTAFLRLNLC